MTLTNATGTSGGSPTIRVLASGSSLNPGATATATVTFSDTSSAAIQFTATVVNQ